MNLRAVKLSPIKAIEHMRVLYAELRACSPSSYYETSVKNLRGSLYSAIEFAAELERLGYHNDSLKHNVFADLLCAIINAIVTPHSEDTRSTLKKEFNKYQEIAGHFHKGDKIVFGFIDEVMRIETGLNCLCKASKTNAEYNFLLGKKPLVTDAEAAALLKVKQMQKSGSPKVAVTDVVEEKKEVDKSSSQSRPV